MCCAMQDCCTHITIRTYRLGRHAMAAPSIAAALQANSISERMKALEAVEQLESHEFGQLRNMPSILALLKLINRKPEAVCQAIYQVVCSPMQGGEVEEHGSASPSTSDEKHDSSEGDHDQDDDDGGTV